MDTARAKQDLEMIDRIITTADRSLHDNWVMYVAWGTFGFLVLLEKHLIASGWKHSADVPYSMVPMVLALVLSIREGKRIRTRGRWTVMDRQASIVLGITIAVLFAISAVAAITRAVDDRAGSLFFNAGLGTAFLILGCQASRTLLAGGSILVASAIAACFSAEYFFAILAAGMFGGSVVPGTLLGVRQQL
jgi:hypothetical protein